MYPIFASFILFIIFLTWSLRRHKNDDRLKLDDFFERERKANETRKQPLDSLSYITIPENLLAPVKTHLTISVTNSYDDVTTYYSPSPSTLTEGDIEELEDYHKRLQALSKHNIVNLTGLSNTDLKLSYGVANLNSLISYDENYTKLAQTLQQLSVLYHRYGFSQAAKDYLEFAVETHTDIIATYLLLAKIYFSLKEYDQLNNLQNSTKDIPGARKVTIDRKLKEFCQSLDLPRS